MKTTYRLRNFRAFRDTGDIALAPITILCGENSSGKSSILKSILLLKQSSIERRSRLIRGASLPPLLFNGELTRLGSWTDVVNGQDRETSIGFAWKVSGRRDEFVSERSFRFSRPRARPPTEVLDFELDVQLKSSHSTSEELSAEVDRVQLVHNGTTLDVYQADEYGIFYKVKVSSLSGMAATSGSFVMNMSYVNMREIAKIVRSMDTAVTLGDCFLETDGPFVTSLQPIHNESWIPFYEAVLSALISSRTGIRGPRPQWISNFETAVKQLRARSLISGGKEEPDTPKLSALRQFASALLFELNHAFDESKAALAPFWKRVRYLGPLRHQPQRFYQFDDTGGVDIGVSGEFTVQVLTLEANTELTSHRISGGEGDTLKLAAPQRSTLLETTNYWLSQMDLPVVEPNVIRQSLYTLHVGQLAVPLPDVGFGVSQVLPIIVECLRAEPGDLVILEQPEIHLHPRVQSSLADFLVARASDGIKFLIESHSEYLIKRLCRRIAEATVPGLSEMTNITFVSQDESGTASCERVQMNDFGEIENWPTGFFDTQEDIYWARAALRRRVESGSH